MVFMLKDENSCSIVAKQSSLKNLNTFNVGQQNFITCICMHKRQTLLVVMCLFSNKTVIRDNKY